MKNIASMKTALLLVLGLLPVVAAAPASANWFSADPETGLRRHIGSAPNPTAEDIRANRAERAKDQSNNSANPARAVVADKKTE